MYEKLNFKNGQVLTAEDLNHMENGIAEATQKSMVSITYAELVELRDNGELIAGMQYRITDYVTTTAQENTRSAGHQFDVIVTADNENTLNEVARACLHEGDTYFSAAGANLAAWKIWYCLENDTERFAWADTQNGKGVIYRMIDEWNNDCPYDFKNIQFKRFAVTEYDKVPSLVVDNEENYYGNYYGALTLFGDQPIQETTYGEDFVWVYTFALKDLATETWHDYTILNSIGLKTDESAIITCHSNVIKEHRDEHLGEHGRKAIWLNNIVFFNCYADISSSDYSDYYSYCHSNSFGSCCNSNSFGNSCYRNSFGNDCNYNSFGNDCYNNSFGNFCCSNSFGNICGSNSFGNDCNYNSFGNSCHYNSFGNSCHSNSFGNDFNYNSFGNICHSNSFGNSCHSNSFGNDCNYNSFGNSCHYNSFGNSCGSNSFGNSCDSNSFGNDCDSLELNESTSNKTASVNSSGETKVFNLADLADLLNS